ncbi:hypothetical protein VTG60DRAFT_1234 [Thermothelomyces hinnuleus]
MGRHVGILPAQFDENEAARMPHGLTGLVLLLVSNERRRVDTIGLFNAAGRATFEKRHEIEAPGMITVIITVTPRSRNCCSSRDVMPAQPPDIDHPVPTERVCVCVCVCVRSCECMCDNAKDQQAQPKVNHVTRLE